MSEEYSNDSVTEVTTTGWLQRIVQSFVGAAAAVLLVIGVMNNADGRRRSMACL
jgi:hypothetical protein